MGFNALNLDYQPFEIRINLDMREMGVMILDFNRDGCFVAFAFDLIPSGIEMTA